MFIPSKWLAECLASVTDAQVAAATAKLKPMDPGFTLLGPISEEQRNLFVAFIGLGEKSEEIHKQIHVIIDAAGVKHQKDLFDKLTPEQRAEVEKLEGQYTGLVSQANVLSELFWLGVKIQYEEQIRVGDVDLGLIEGFQIVTRPAEKEPEPEVVDLSSLFGEIESRLRQRGAQKVEQPTGTDHDSGPIELKEA